MDVEDPVSFKFKKLVEALMAKTTSEIVKVFAEVLLETRLEISRSWKEIDELKQKLEEREEQRTETVLTSQPTCSLKKEKEPVLVTHQIAVSDARTIRPEDEDTGSEGLVQETHVENPFGETIEAAHESATPLASTAVINPTVNSPNKIQEAQVSQSPSKRKRGRPAKLNKVTQNQTSKSAESVVTPQQSSSSTGVIILGSKRKDAVVRKKNYIQRKYASLGRVSNTHRLRDRQHLSSQRPCLCCSSDQCSRLPNQPETRVSQRVNTCRKCGKKFNERMQFKAHECSVIYECNRCGQTFTELKIWAAHKRGVHQSLKQFPYYCCLCDQKFATQCGWSMHKRFHTYSDVGKNDTQDAPDTSNVGKNAQQDAPNTFKSLALSKELKNKLEVRLERISDAQLEAALSPQGFMLHDETSSLSSSASSMNLPMSANLSFAEIIANAPVPCKESSSQTVTKGVTHRMAYKCPTNTQTVKQPDATSDNLIPTASCQTEPIENKTLTVREVVTSDEESRTSDESVKERNTPSKKRKMSECDHDAYNGVFPVEKILGWRNTKLFITPKRVKMKLESSGCLAHYVGQSGKTRGSQLEVLYLIRRAKGKNKKM